MADVRRPAVGDQPLLWKEVFVDAGLKLGGFGKVVVLGMVALSFVPAGFIFWFTIIDPPGWRSGPSWWSAGRWEDFGRGMNIYLRTAGTVATCLVFLAVAVRGAGVVSGERDRHTLDALLTTPLSARTILWGKWWGCLLGMRWAWAWILAIWAMALATGGVHPVMFPVAMVSIAIYASGFAWIGVFCSVQMRTTLRATMGAICLSVFLAGGYFLIFAFCCALPLSFAGPGPDDGFDLMASFLAGFSPPACVAWLPIHEFDDRELSMFYRKFPFPSFWLMGLIGWSALSWGLYRKSLGQFRRTANRVPIEPERTARRGPPPLPKRPTREPA